MIGPGGLAVEAPGGEAEGGVRRRRHGGEEEAVGNIRRLCARSAEKPALETAASTGELPRHHGIIDPAVCQPTLLMSGPHRRPAACCDLLSLLLNSGGSSISISITNTAAKTEYKTENTKKYCGTEFFGGFSTKSDDYRELSANSLSNSPFSVL